MHGTITCHGKTIKRPSRKLTTLSKKFCAIPLRELESLKRSKKTFLDTGVEELTIKIGSSIPLPMTQSPYTVAKNPLHKKIKARVTGLLFYDEDMNHKHIFILLTLLMYTSAIVACMTTSNIALFITFASMSLLAYFTLLHFQQTTCTKPSNQVD